MEATNNICNVDVELAVIASLISNSQNYYKTSSLRPEHFFDPLLGKMYGLLNADFDKGGSADGHFLIATMPEHKDTLLKIMKIGPTLNLTKHCNLISALSEKRQIKELFREYSDKIDAGTDIYEILGEIDSKISTSKDAFSLRTEQQVCVDILESLKDDNSCYSTGITRLDMAMAGGLYKKKTYCIAARQKVGKTVALGSISHNLSKGKVKHLFIAAEMGCNEILQRSIAHDLNRNSIAFYNEQDRKSPQFNKLIADYAVKNDNPAIYCDAPSISFDRLKRLIVSSKKKYNIEGVVLDYLQIVTGMRGSQNEAQFQGEVAQWLAEIAKKENIFILYAAQLNREGLLRGSDGIRNAVDQLYTMHQPEGDTIGNRFMLMDASRYTIRTDIGSASSPALKIDKHGPYLIES